MCNFPYFNWHQAASLVDRAFVAQKYVNNNNNNVYSELFRKLHFMTSSALWLNQYVRANLESSIKRFDIHNHNTRTSNLFLYMLLMEQPR